MKQDEPCKLEAIVLAEVIERCQAILGKIASVLGLDAPPLAAEIKGDENVPFLRACLNSQLVDLRYMEHFLNHIMGEIKELRLLALGSETEKKQ